MGTIIYRFSQLTNMGQYAARIDDLGPPIEWLPAVNSIAQNGNIQAPGIYIIENTNTQSFYVGISSNFGQRFDTRAQATSEFGLSSDYMQGLYVYFCTEISYADHGQNFLGYQFPDNTNNGYNVIVDGENLDLETLLVNAFLQSGVEGFDYSTNTRGMGAEYGNGAEYPLLVQVYSVRVPNGFNTEAAYAGQLEQDNDGDFGWAAEAAANGGQFVRTALVEQ